MNSKLRSVKMRSLASVVKPLKSGVVDLFRRVPKLVGRRVGGFSGDSGVIIRISEILFSPRTEPRKWLHPTLTESSHFLLLGGWLSFYI